MSTPSKKRLPQDKSRPTNKRKKEEADVKLEIQQDMVRPTRKRKIEETDIKFEIRQDVRGSSKKNLSLNTLPVEMLTEIILYYLTTTTFYPENLNPIIKPELNICLEEHRSNILFPLLFVNKQMNELIQKLKKGKKLKPFRNLHMTFACLGELKLFDWVLVAYNIDFATVKKKYSKNVYAMAMFSRSTVFLEYLFHECEINVGLAFKYASMTSCLALINWLIGKIYKFDTFL